MKHFLTISLPCYQRPERTRRALESILNQTMHGFEVLMTGDDCPVFKEREFIDYLKNMVVQFRQKGSILWVNNNEVHTGNWGAAIRDQHIKAATGEYFEFMGSDDVLMPNHVESRQMFIRANPDLDFAYFDTWVEPYKAPRNAQLKPGMIGHSELIIKTAFLKKMPPHGTFYGHDWDLVYNMLVCTNKYEKAVAYPQTYMVMSVKGNEEQGID